MSNELPTTTIELNGEEIGMIAVAFLVYTQTRGIPVTMDHVAKQVLYKIEAALDTLPEIK